MYNARRRYHPYEERRNKSSMARPHRPEYVRYEADFRRYSRFYGRPSGYGQWNRIEPFYTETPREFNQKKYNRDYDIREQFNTPKKRQYEEKDPRLYTSNKEIIENEKDVQQPPKPIKNPNVEKVETDDEESNLELKKQKAYKKEYFRLKDNINNLKRISELRDQTVKINNDLIAKR